MKLQKKDIEILKLLQKDAKLSTSDIAEKVNLSQSPCWRRIARYEEENIIKGKVNLLNRHALGMDMVVFTTIKLASSHGDKLQEFEQQIEILEEVVECYTMTGNFDYILKIITRDIKHYEKFLRKHLLQLPNIGDVHSHISVTQIKNTTELPISTQLSAS